MAMPVRLQRKRPRACRQPAGSQTVSHDALISYSHALDGRWAPALQHVLHRLAKPWYRLQALRVSRDDAGRSATPALWPSIERALQTRSIVGNR